MGGHNRQALHGEGLSEHARHRREAALAGHTGDEAAARHFFSDRDPEVRSTALAALVRLGRLTTGDVDAAVADPSPAVRRRVCELAADVPSGDLSSLLGDDDSRVVEAACFAAGERQDRAAVARLADIARTHPEPLCRESAVAALGAIGDEGGLPAILAACSDKPAVRRRAVIALAPFEGPEVEAALSVALSDRDWQVRQAAEDLAGRGDTAAETTD